MKKTKLTDSIADLIANEISKGVPMSVSAQLHGVAASTFFKWVKEGREDIENGKETDKSIFVDKIERAKGESVRILSNMVLIHSKNDWRAAAWMLERRFPEFYGKELSIAHSGGVDVRVTVSEDILPEE